MKNSKRILSVTIKRMVDDSPDTSWLGEYSDTRTSEFSIDRMHSDDCMSQEVNHKVAVDQLERIIFHLNEWRRIAADNAESTDWESLDEALDTCAHLQDELTECDCGGHQVSSREYRYFNPSFNYVDKHGNALPENTPDEVRKYVQQDYERMESLNNGSWCFVGVRAEAKIGIPQGESYLIQELTSGGLFGIESDSEDSYIKGEEQNQLAELRDVLKQFGFSSRAISKAFQTIEHKDE